VKLFIASKEEDLFGQH